MKRRIMALFLITTIVFTMCSVPVLGEEQLEEAGDLRKIIADNEVSESDTFRKDDNKVSEVTLKETEAESEILENKAGEEKEIIASGEGAEQRWELDKDGLLVIEGNGPMEDVSDFDNDGWLNSTIKSKIKTVIIEQGITSICGFAFRNCENLVKVVLPDGITEIDYLAFGGCVSMTDINLPNGINELGGHVFMDCKNIASIDIPGSIKIITNGSFSNCTGLREVTISEGVEKIDYAAFAGCTSLRSVNIPESVSLIGEIAFSGCTGLKNVSISKGVKAIHLGAFGGCNSLEKFDVDSSNPEFASVDGVLFNKEKTWLKAYPANKTDIVYNIPETVESIGGSGYEPAFDECRFLRKIIVPRGVNYIDYSDFSMCKSLQEISVVSGNQKYISIDGVLFNQKKTELIKYPIGKVDSSYHVPQEVSEINLSAFAGCININSIVMSDKIKRISSEAFKGCTSLASIVIPKGVTEIGYLSFKDCSSLKSIYFKGIAPEIDEDAFLNVNAEVFYPIGDSSWKEMASAGYGYGGNLIWKTWSPESSNLNIKKEVIKVSKITISSSSKKIAAGKKVKLTAKVSPSNAANKKLKWKSSNTKVATVNQSGIVTMKKNSGGKSVTITVTAVDGSKKKATYKITSMKGVVKKVAISGKKTITLKAGKTLKLKAKVTASNSKKANKTLKWISSNTKYATVSSTGKVKTKKAGKRKTVTITAMATDGSGKKASVKVKLN